MASEWNAMSFRDAGVLLIDCELKPSDLPGLLRSAKAGEIASHGHVLTSGRYVGTEAVEDDGEPFGQKMKRLTATLAEQFVEAAKLEKAIRANLKGLGHGL